MSGFTSGVASAVRPVASPLSGGERLTLLQFAVEAGVLGEVMHEHVTTPAGQSGLADVLGGELVGQSVVASPEGREALEHLAVARRVSTPSGDDVASVFAVCPDRAYELAALGQRLAERRA
nr:hypothetical protein [Halorussus aquaticus]